MCVCVCVCIYITFSKILENEGKSDTGLYLDRKFLSPFLKTHWTRENFSHDGNIPEVKDWLHIYIYIYVSKVSLFFLHVPLISC